MGDLYRRLQGDYRHVLDSAGAMCLSSPTLPPLSANVDYFKVIVGYESNTWWN